MKAVDQNKYNDYHLRYSSFDFAIPFSFEFRQRNFLAMSAMCHDPSIHSAELKSSIADLKNVKEEDREELIAIRFPTNVNKTEDLASRIVFQKNERFKNKQQVLFGGKKQI